LLFSTLLSALLSPCNDCAPHGAEQVEKTTSPKTVTQGSSSGSPSWNPAEGFLKLDVVVTDRSGEPIAGLALQDFKLWEDGVPNKILSLQEYGGFSGKNESPSQLVLFVDATGPQFSRAAIVKESVKKFLRQRGARRDARLAETVSLFWLSSDGLWTARKGQATNDGEALVSDLGHIDRQHVIWRITDRRDPLNRWRALALVSAMKKLESGKKLLVLIDAREQGPEVLARPSNSFDLVVWFSTLLRESHTALYCIHLPSNETPRTFGLDDLQPIRSSQQAKLFGLDERTVAVESGGRVLEASNDLEEQISAVANEAKAYYTLSFDPQATDQPDEYHDLKVAVEKTGLIARTNTGYYDQPYYRDHAQAAKKGVSVKELDQIVQAARGTPDAEATRLFNGLALEQRLDAQSFATLRSEAPGERSREALLVLASTSTFRDLPTAQIPVLAPPDRATQQLMITRTINFLNKTIPELPNFFATRTTVHYEETPPRYEQAGQPGIGYEPLHVKSKSVDTVLYRHGHEVTTGRRTGDQKAEESHELTVGGIFGPILSTVVADANAVGFTWTHWEQNGNDRHAVFRYFVPADKSHYEISDCCLPEEYGSRPYRMVVGYQGEMTIDPATGELFQIKVQADLKPTLPVVRADIAVEYSQVIIGGKKYLCPVKAVSISRARTLRVMQQWQASFTTSGPFVTKLNVVSFGQYQMFRAGSQLLPGFTPVPHDLPPEPGPQQAPGTAPPMPR
jgi:VWFA-related protein